MPLSFSTRSTPGLWDPAERQDGPRASPSHHVAIRREADCDGVARVITTAARIAKECQIRPTKSGTRLGYQAVARGKAPSVEGKMAKPQISSHHDRRCYSKHRHCYGLSGWLWLLLLPPRLDIRTIIAIEPARGTACTGGDFLNHDG